MSALPIQEVAYRHLIETGTGAGAGVRAAKHWGLETIHSIEYDAECYERARREFEGDPAITIHLGSSPDVLREIIDPLVHTLFWLDAHYSGAAFGQAVDPRYGECPLLAELEVILAVAWARPPRVLIDDASLFMTHDFATYEIVTAHEADWPTLEQIEACVKPLRVGYAPREDYLFLYEPEAWEAARMRAQMEIRQ